MCKQARITAESHSLKYYAEKIIDVYKRAINSNSETSLIDKIKNILKK